MNDGFRMKQKLKERLHNETLLYNRINTAYLLQVHTKKKIKPKRLYSLPFDKQVSDFLTLEQQSEMFHELVPLITNGKHRGFIDGSGDDRVYNKERKVIAYINEGIIEYIN